VTIGKVPTRERDDVWSKGLSLFTQSLSGTGAELETRSVDFCVSSLAGSSARFASASSWRARAPRERWPCSAQRKLLPRPLWTAGLPHFTPPVRAAQRYGRISMLRTPSFGQMTPNLPPMTWQMEQR
jgi:hypothetical protein